MFQLLVIGLSLATASRSFTNTKPPVYFRNHSSLIHHSNPLFDCKLKRLGNIIQINKLYNFSPKESNDIDLAHCIWETVITGFIVNRNIKLVIDFDVEAIDGVDGILGQASWNQGYYFSGFGRNYAMPISGRFVIDSYDLNSLSNDNGFIYAVVHEIGHILGIEEEIWTLNNVLESNKFRYNGTHGLRAFKEQFIMSANYIPIEQDGGNGTAGSHWDEIPITDMYNRSFTSEIMTGYLTDENYLTSVTAHSLSDIGYEINPYICSHDSDCIDNVTCGHGFIDMCNQTFAISGSFNVCYSHNLIVMLFILMWIVLQ